jgi:hypothetical protein
MPKISRQFALRLADFASPMILPMISGRDAAPEQLVIAFDHGESKWGY